MTESHLDALLDELVPAEPREGWDDVLHRARRSQRRYVALVVAIAVLVLAPATWAAVRAFEGTPATPSVQRNFGQMNSELAQAEAAFAAPGNGMDIQQANVSKAHGVLQVQTSYGPLDLWAAPELGGKGRCYFLSWVRDGAKPQAYGGGACTTPAAEAEPIDVGIQWEASHPALSVLVGTVGGPETTLDVKLRGRGTVTLPVVEHFALGVVPGGDFPAGSFPILSYTGRDASGKVIVSEKAFGSKLPGPMSAAQSRRAARYYRKQWFGDIARRAKDEPAQRFANLPEAEFRARLAAAAKRYDFTVQSVQFLHPRQVAPLVVVRTADSRALLKPFVAGKIFAAIDPAKLKDEVEVRSFEALFFEAQDERGVPFFIAQNEERGLTSGLRDGGGIAWTRDPTAMPGPLGMIG
jgi:hypothetical protein